MRCRRATVPCLATGRVTISIGELGEFGLIARIAARLPAGDRVVLGPGDDAAVVRAPDSRIVATTDLLVERRHFRRDWSGSYDVGRKAAAQNLADIVAMGAVPTALLVGVVLPGELPVTWMDELTDGLRDECALTGASVVGGDVSGGNDIILGVTAFGDLEGREPVTRSGARPGDIVALAGRLGWAAAGYAVLSRGFRTPRAIVAAHRRPAPPYAAGPAAARAGATAMCDVSDGLVQDLGHICEASGVGIEIDRGTLPVPEPLTEVASAIGADPFEWVITGGEDHALTASFPAGVTLPEPWYEIGRVVRGEGVVVDGMTVEGRGWEHFR